MIQAYPPALPTPGRRARPSRWIQSVWIPVVLYGAAAWLFAVTPVPEYGFAARVVGWVLFVAGTYPILNYARRPVGIPLVEIVCLSYVIFFALPILFENELLLYDSTIYPDTDIVFTVLCSALIAIGCIRLGAAGANHLVTAGRFRFGTDPNRLFALGTVLVVIGLLIQTGALAVLPSVERLLRVIASPDLGLALLAGAYYQPDLSPAKKSVALVAVVVYVTLGALFGTALYVLQPIVIWVLMRWITVGRVPLTAVTIGAILFFAFQPVKLIYRGHADELAAMGISERIPVLAQISSEYWGNVMSGGGSVAEQVNESAAQRLSLLLQTSRLVDYTPRLIPYKSGESIVVLAYSVIPRFLWREKPEIGFANSRYAVEYGLQHPDLVNTYTVGVGHLGEAYVNLGIGGLPFIFLAIGFLYRVPLQLVADRWTTNPAALALGVAAAIAMVPIGDSIANTFGTALQAFLIQVLIVRVVLPPPAVSVGFQGLPAGLARPV